MSRALELLAVRRKLRQTELSHGASGANAREAPTLRPAPANVNMPSPAVPDYLPYLRHTTSCGRNEAARIAARDDRRSARCAR